MKLRHISILFKGVAIGAVGVSSLPLAAAPVVLPHTQQTQTAQNRQTAEDIEHKTFNWFWESANPRNGLVPDRTPLSHGAASVASVGFGLTAYGIGAKRGYITRPQAVERTLTTLRFLYNLPQGDAPTGTAGKKGFFYHFLDPDTGLRVADWSELSSVDTALLMGGVLFAQSYYDHATPKEAEIRSLADKLYRRIDWPWMKGNGEWLSMGWSPEKGFIPAEWKGYNEGLIVYTLALASPTHALSAETWSRWTKTFAPQWGAFQGRTFLSFAPLFGHQYSQSWIDFRGIQDDFSREYHTTYFNNSREATYAQREYARQNPGEWRDYGTMLWGLTASDGPGITDQMYEGKMRHYLAYNARGAGRDYISDDGTVAPTAAGGSVAFAPEIVFPTLRDMQKRYGGKLYGRYGFVDSFNPSFRTKTGDMWIDSQQIGIDQGPIVIMMENWRSGFVWKVMQKNPYIRHGLKQAGFQGGWLEQTP